MLRRQIRMYRKATVANDVNTPADSNSLEYKNTNLQRVLKKHTQSL
jgi:hypothetical protein